MLNVLIGSHKLNLTLEREENVPMRQRRRVVEDGHQNEPCLGGSQLKNHQVFLGLVVRIPACH